MSWAKLTLTAFESYLNMSGKSLFDELELPEGIDKETLIDNIYLRAGEYEALYSDPEFIRRAVPVWGRKWYRTFDKWITALNVKYDPLYNYDRHEEWSDEGSGSKNGESSMESETDRILNSETTSENNTDYSGTDETTNTRSAFDSDNYQPHDKSVTGSENTTAFTGSETAETTGKDTTTGSGTMSEHTTDTSQHTGHIYGNIGVTTSQQMLADELKIDKWNIYEHITDLFIEEFTIPVYE